MKRSVSVGSRPREELGEVVDATVRVGEIAAHPSSRPPVGTFGPGAQEQLRVDGGPGADLDLDSRDTPPVSPEQSGGGAP
ncbi:MAG TPA: hypothetical protein VIJ48_05605, partial [Acidimicrobiia bacterium]